MFRRFKDGVTLLGGGPWREDDLALALSYAPHLVCADGGANGLVRHAPKLIIGDLDSLEDRAGWAERLGDNLFHDPDQDTTDFQKCLKHVAAPFIIGVGFLGGRIDHELATLGALTTARRPIILIGDEDVIFAPKTQVMIPTIPGQRVSIFPMGPLTGRSQGLKWPLDGLSLAPNGRVATSNEASGPMVTLAFDTDDENSSPAPLVILPRENISAALSALEIDQTR